LNTAVAIELSSRTRYK